jgi:hypothetical protein
VPIEGADNLVQRSSHWLNRKLYTALAAVLMLMSVTLFGSLAAAQQVTVQFLKGRSGKPIRKGERISVYFVTENRRRILDLHTDKQGTVQFDADGAETFEVTAVGYIACGEQPIGAPAHKYPVSEILKSGLLTQNNCGHLNSEPIRGRLQYFVRPASWWELFKG